MTLGEKIKKIRISKSLTQKNVAGDKITRNMLSRIETDQANPSLSTLEYIASKLDVPISFLFSDFDNGFIYEKRGAINEIYESFKCKNYKACISIIERLSSLDEELSLLLTLSHFELGKSYLLQGSLISSKKHLELADSYSKNTAIDLQLLKSLIPMYIAIASNIQSPLLEFDQASYLDGLNNGFNYEFYKYITLDFEYNYQTESFKKHAEAKKLIKERRYIDAVPLLLYVAELNNTISYNSYVIFGVYSDLEICYKELADFEKAYKYASKKLSLLEGFKT